METKDENQETILQQILGLAFIGEFIATLLVLVPAGILACVRLYVFHAEGKVGNGFFILCSIITFLWLLYLERVEELQLQPRFSRSR